MLTFKGAVSYDDLMNMPFPKMVKLNELACRIIKLQES